MRYPRKLPLTFICFTWKLGIPYLQTKTSMDSSFAERVDLRAREMMRTYQLWLGLGPPWTGIQPQFEVLFCIMISFVILHMRKLGRAVQQKACFSSDNSMELSHWTLKEVLWITSGARHFKCLLSGAWACSSPLQHILRQGEAIASSPKSFGSTSSHCTSPRLNKSWPMSRLLKKAKTHYMHKLLSAQGPLKITIRESRPSTQHLSQHHCYIKVRPCFQGLQKAQPSRTTTVLATALAAETFPLVAGV